jgi:hypothetical protein
MLDKVHKLRDLLTNAQIVSLKARLGDHWESFQRLTESKTEQEAMANFEQFKLELSSLHVSTLVAIHNELDGEQREILTDLL